MRDAVELEWVGIPAVAIVHETMSGSARAMSRVSGMDDYEFVTVDYPHVPLAVWAPEEIRDIARKVAPAVVERLRRSASPGTR